jgi:flagellar secretion chaperone FliS
LSFNYRQQALASSNPIELVIALYDGAIQFLRQAITAVEANDSRGRRQAVKRALDIFLHLQSRLRCDLDGKVAETLSQFYTEMFRYSLLASSANSREGFEQIVARLSQLRDAWRVVARDPGAMQALERGRQPAYMRTIL